MDNIYIGRGEQFVHCREIVHSSECPLSEVHCSRKNVTRKFSFFFNFLKFSSVFAVQGGEGSQKTKYH